MPTYIIKIPEIAGPKRKAPELVILITELNLFRFSGGTNLVMYTEELGPKNEPAILMRKRIT
ncbi:hypothetical protein J6TS2_07240 [Heyndrickxia sporothermodurans]|nr:hypothetical protein J6TS2_07240 [Heyndrickxia sporothermodurans]